MLGLFEYLACSCIDHILDIVIVLVCTLVSNQESHSGTSTLNLDES